ncbi:MAG TPA: hypothetical protein VEU52_00055 [Candidatus Limnocylindrales bacterium]|nr:hypothetical protein [Candidatus Limnocylindrales bacterium]
MTFSRARQSSGFARLGAFFLTFAACAALLAFAASSVAKAPAAPLFSPDKGKFRILINGQPAGHEEFELSAKGANWVAHGTTELNSPQGSTRVTGTLELHADGSPAQYDWTMQGVKRAAATIVFNGAAASIDLRVEGTRPYTQQLTFSSPRVAVVDNNLYHQYEVLARLYDWNAKGAQAIAVLVPQDLTPGTLTLESLGKQDLDGKKLEELRVKTEDLELLLFLDGQRLMKIISPSANAEIVRE